MFVWSFGAILPSSRGQLEKTADSQRGGTWKQDDLRWFSFLLRHGLRGQRCSNFLAPTLASRGIFDYAYTEQGGARWKQLLRIVCIISCGKLGGDFAARVVRRFSLSAIWEFDVTRW